MNFTHHVFSIRTAAHVLWFLFLFFLFLIKTFNSLKARLVFTYESPSWQCNLWRLPPDASAAASLYRLLTQRWSPPPWIMHEIRVQITPINMQYSLRWLNCHLIVMNMWKMSGTTYSPPLLILTFPFFFFFLPPPEMSLRRSLKISLIKPFSVFLEIISLCFISCRQTMPHSPARPRTSCLYVKAVKLVSSSGVVSETSPLAARWLDTIGINHSGELAQVRFMSAP